MQFMSGRYGTDETMFVMVGIASVLAIINCFVHSLILQMIVYLIILLAFARSFSRNIAARRAENYKIKSLFNKIAMKSEEHRRRSADFTHVYKKCPHCKAVLRLPRRKGKHTTVCPRCNKTFKVRVFKDYN